MDETIQSGGNCILVGKKAIQAYVGRNFNKTIKTWIESRGFPAKKIDGQWHSDKNLIEEWNRQQITAF